MSKIFLDSNIWLRFFLKDIEEQYIAINHLFSLIEEGRFRAYTSSLVFLEINFILSKTYKLPIAQVLVYFEAIQKVRNITILESTNITKAINYYEKCQIKFPDCLIASQLPKGVTLCTYDTDFKKIRSLPLATPKTLID